MRPLPLLSLRVGAGPTRAGSMPSVPRLALCAFLLSACLMLCASCARHGRAPDAKVALVIGNADYENLAPLRNPGNDAADMCNALKELRFTTLCHTNVRDRAALDAAVRAYAELLDPNTVGVVYYSGHGVQAGSANYLIPTQLRTPSAGDDPIPALYGVDELFARLERKSTRFQLVILDACRSDLFRAGSQSEARSVGSPPAARSALLRSLEVVARAKSGVQPVNHAPAGTRVLYATASNDTAYDGKGRNGPLTRQILLHIRTRGIFVEEFIKRVTDGVEQETARLYGEAKTPYLYGSLGGRYCFAGCPGDNDPPPPTGF